MCVSKKDTYLQLVEYTVWSLKQCLFSLCTLPLCTMTFWSAAPLLQLAVIISSFTISSCCAFSSQQSMYGGISTATTSHKRYTTLRPNYCNIQKMNFLTPISHRRYTTTYTIGRSHCTIHKMSLSEEDDDDGWGESGTVVSNISTDDSSIPSNKISKNKELARLQDDIAAKQNKNNIDSVNSRVRDINSGSGEKDLFIPIVTLISVIGFTSLYGYEMLRLYLRGELYLPWEN